MKTPPRRNFVANACEIVRNLPADVEIFVSGGFLIVVGVLSLAFVLYLLSRGV